MRSARRCHHGRQRGGHADSSGKTRRRLVDIMSLIGTMMNWAIPLKARLMHSSTRSEHNRSNA